MLVRNGSELCLIPDVHTETEHYMIDHNVKVCRKTPNPAWTHNSDLEWQVFRELLYDAFLEEKLIFPNLLFGPAKDWQRPHPLEMSILPSMDY